MNITPLPRLAFSLLAIASLCATALTQDKLRVGDQAPDFLLPAATKDTIDMGGIHLSATVGNANIILAFYPADWSGGCTKEMCTMRDNFAALSGLHATVYGISGDYLFSHREWAKHLDLQFPLLSDHNHEAAKAYQSFNPATGYNIRTVYVVDRKGRIAYIDLAYKPGAAESFEHLKSALESTR